MGLIFRVAQHIAASPNRLDIVLTAGRRRELLAQLAHKDVDDLELRLVHAVLMANRSHIYSQEKPDDAHIANVLTEDEARRIASNIAKLPILLGKEGQE